ncbi:hypothetical protein LZZ85_14530 [Terrimonas sp. NA20]|uniref:Glycosyltransferase RgtA/B/C/D-like domain-containing protein n=1 Tax=Terrimonas ginsenosidimutans TaxID=2908004 RepID=A0ABS9KT57_9BACT|nr:hypothetical protein [Terrimonas ginsenosidimutans]MCG2615513.1 hypothetical protein [Terrimonas ginsenosidimutans]
MMSLLSVILLTVVQFFTGFGVLGFFRLKIKPGLYISLSILMGIAIFSFIPFLLQLVKLPLTSLNIFLSLLATCVWLNVNIKKNWQQFMQGIRSGNTKLRMYEWPVLLCLLFIVAISVWRCFYLPPTPRDLTSGAEVIAEYATREKTMINSVFTVNLESTNNQYKPPFITSLQIIYKYAGFPFGQIWLSSIFICLLVFMYHGLTRYLHRSIAGILLIIFVAVPEMYAYTFMALFDYSNAVFFFLSFYFLIGYFKKRKPGYMALAGVLMGIATYIRSETLILAGLACPLLLVYHLRQKDSFSRIMISGCWMIAPSVILYLVTITLYFNLYLPVNYDVQGLLNTDLANLRPLWERFKAMHTHLILSKEGFYAYIFYFFALVLIADLAVSFRMNRDSRNWLFAVLLVYFGMPVLGYLLPLLDIDHSTKRGLFRIFPLMIMYMGTSTVLRCLSLKITNWEQRSELTVRAG